MSLRRRVVGAFFRTTQLPIFQTQKKLTASQALRKIKVPVDVFLSRKIGRTS